MSKCRVMVRQAPLCSLRAVRFLVVFVLYLICLCPPLAAQTTQSGNIPATTFGVVTNITSTPSPGVGHDYLHDLSEIVNPANGALSIRIEATRPHERGLNFPIYAFLYDSDQEYTVSMNQNNLPCVAPPGMNQADMGYGLPMCVVSVGAPQISDRFLWSASQYTLNSGPNTLTYDSLHTYVLRVTNTNAQEAVCQINTGYVFEDPYGVRHNLGVTAIQSAYSSNMTGTPASICQAYFGISPVALGGDPHYKALVQNESPMLNVPFSSVVDSHGNVFTGTGSVTAEDSNGNFQNGTGRQGTYAGFQNLVPSVGTHSVTYPGTSAPYTYTVNNQTMTYSIGYQDITSYAENLCGGDVGGSGNNSSNTYAGTTNNGSTLAHPKYTAIGLPDGLSYNFTYDPIYGLINKITYPTGAWVQYTWAPNTNSEMMGWGTNGNIDPIWGQSSPYQSGAGGGAPNSSQCYFRHDFPAIQKRVVSYDGVNPAQEQDFSYATNWDSANPNYWDTKTTTVTTIDLLRPGHPSFKTIYNYIAGQIEPAVGSHTVTSGVPLEDTIVYQDTSGNVLRTVKKVWSSLISTAELTGECEILPNGNVTGKFYQYATYPNPYEALTGTEATDSVTDVAEYDYGLVSSSCVKPSSTPTRETVTAYASFGNTPLWPSFSDPSYSLTITPPNMWDRPSSVKTYDHGTLLAETDYGYDETAIASVSSPIGHDETNYASTSSLARGNLTSVTKKCFGCTDAKTTVSYDATGQAVSLTDPDGNQTTMSHADNYTSDDGSPSGNTNTYLTQLTRSSTNGTKHISSFQYDFNNGQLRTLTDENLQVSKYYYKDPWNRLTEADFPDGGQTTTSYIDSGPNPTVSTTQLLNLSDVTKTSTVIMDAAGHTIQTQLTSDPYGTDYVDTSYDGLGHVSTISNPYRSKSDATYGLTAFAYDSLGRKTIQTQPDGNSLQWCFDGIASSGQKNCSSNSSPFPNVSWVDQSDETGNDWQLASDALGRLTSVVEPSTAKATYTYNAQGNLLTVNQSGLSGESPRARSFTYDSLSRLVTATNPESGTVCYGLWSGSNCVNGYDPNGNLIAKTDARGVITSYGFDALGRVMSKTYSSGSAAATRSSCFQYDAARNGVGRLAVEWTQSGTCPSSPPSNPETSRSMLAYDAMGRITREQQCHLSKCTTGTPDTNTMEYDLAGNLTVFSVGNPSISLGYSYDAADRLKGVGSSMFSESMPGNVLSVGSYWPFGAIQTMTLGTNVNVTRTYDNRLRPTGEVASHP
jgi:YD repeat-containing protein